MKNFTKNKYILILSIIILVSVVLFIGYKAYEKKLVKQQIELSKTEIAEIYTNFKDEQDRPKKVEILRNILYKLEEYKNENKTYEEVLKEYNDKIDEMKNYFVTEYEKTIHDNTINNIEEIQDKEQINNAKNNLSNIIEAIKSEENIILTSEEIKKYEETTTQLIASYDSRIKSIEEAEKKAEEERLAKEEAERISREESLAAFRSQEQQTSTPSNGGSAYSQPTENPKPGRVDISRLEHNWHYNLDTGEKIPGTDVWIDRSNGNTYDENGNFLYNGYDLW